MHFHGFVVFLFLGIGLGFGLLLLYLRTLFLSQSVVVKQIIPIPFPNLVHLLGEILLGSQVPIMIGSCFFQFDTELFLTN